MSNFTDYLAQIGATITFSDAEVMQTTAGQFQQSNSFIFNSGQIKAARTVAEQLMQYVDTETQQDMQYIAYSDGDPDMSVEELTAYVLAASYYKGYNDPNYNGLAVEFNFSELDANAVAGFAQTIYNQNDFSPGQQIDISAEQENEATPLQAAIISIAASYVGVDIAHHNTGLRTPEEIAQVHEFNYGGLGGPWCADIMGHYFQMIAEHTGTEPLMNHEDILSTDKLIDEAINLDAFQTFQDDSTPAPGSIITFGIINDEHRAEGHGNVNELIERDDLRNGQHTGLVVSSEIIADGPYAGWTMVQSIDANVSDENIQTVYPLTYVINPETNEAITFGSPGDYPDSPSDGFAGQFAAVGYVDPMRLPNAEEVNAIITNEGFVPDGLNEGVEYLPGSETWLSHMDIPQVPQPAIPEPSNSQTALANYTQYNTLESFLEGIIGGDVQATFDNPELGSGTGPFSEMNAYFVGHEYEMSGDMFASAAMLGQEILDIAEANGVDITTFEDIQSIMGYDNDVTSLSAEELGAYLIGQSIAGNSNLADPLKEMGAVFTIESSEVAVQLGQQVFGDNRPEQSSQDTSTEIEIDNGPIMRC